MTVVFGVLLVAHVLSAFTAVISGGVTALAGKGPGRHPRWGRVYLLALTVVAVSATGMGVLHRGQDLPLVVLAGAALGSAAVGVAARRRRGRRWPVTHIAGMGGSYLALLTGFVVDKAPDIPAFAALPHAAPWLLPAALGALPLVRALRRHTTTGRVAPSTPTPAAPGVLDGAQTS